MDVGYSHIWHASPVRDRFWGWVDRFAAPAHIHRQRELASKNRLRSIYTPQVVRNGRDWPQWGGAESRISVSPETARVHPRCWSGGLDPGLATDARSLQRQYGSAACGLLPTRTTADWPPG